MATEPTIWRSSTQRRERRLGGEIGDLVRHLDYVLLAAVAGIVGYGLWVLAAVTRDDEPGDPHLFLRRQAIYAGVGVIALAAAAAVNPDLWRRWRLAIFLLSIGLLVAVLAAGEATRGSQRWIDLGSFQLQPSEIGKVALVLFFAGFVADRANRDGQLQTVTSVVGLAAIPLVLIFVEPDFGTALVSCVAIAAVLFFAGIRWIHLAVLTLLAAGLSVLVLWALPHAGVQVLKPYQVDRLVGFVNPESDPSGTTYNVTQSITAVGAGGLRGRGMSGASQTNLDYLPEHATDFIFASLAELRGFLGAAILLLLYALIIWRGIKIIAIAENLFAATVAGALVTALLFQIFLNLGMTIGIAPITGITLPFVSYGGSSMITSLAMIGILQAIHARGRLATRR